MATLTVKLNARRVKELVFQLPPKEFLSLADAIEDRAETMFMMKLAETGFREWNEEGEDIYDAQD